MRQIFGWLWIAGLLLGSALAQPARPTPANPPPPAFVREFRAAWIATVKNIDWPSRPGLPVAQQQAELLEALDQAARLNLNALLFQVRPTCDAFYDSPIEPWSEYLTGRQGVAPEPLWDPLAFAVREAHARGLELHAWFNPFRARLQAKGPMARNHITQRSPHLVQTVGSDLWLDPGEAEAREHAIRVILDVVQRYDIDGVHLDDYFYPYPFAGLKVPFADDRSWQRYQRGGGRLARDDWRRENVNQFVRQLSESVRREKPWVRFGISPFGIWRPGIPPGIRGMDAFDVIYADARKWLQEGWVDYMAPQLYWPIAPKEQSFSTLLGWWNEQSTRKVPIWPGVATARIGQDRTAQEIANQIRLVRRQPNPNGYLFWNFSSLRSNLGGIANVLTNQLFQWPVLAPELNAGNIDRPAAPELSFELDAKRTRLQFRWEAATNQPVRRYVLQSRTGKTWRTEVLSPSQSQKIFRGSPSMVVPEEILLTPIGRGGLAGEPARWKRSSAAPAMLPPARPSAAIPAPKPRGATNSPAQRPIPR